jgi:hypothetical protein
MTSNRHRPGLGCQLTSTRMGHNMPLKLSATHAFAIGAAVVWGLVEFIALWRSRWAQRRQSSRVPSHSG